MKKTMTLRNPRSASRFVEPAADASGATVPTRTAARLPTPDVVGALHAEHRYAARLLDALDDKLAAAQKGQPLDRDAVLAVMTYMTRHLDGYHHRREDALFERLGQRDPQAAKAIAALKREHRTIGEAGRAVIAALERPSPDGDSKAAAPAAGVAAYVDAMRAHMAFEERELFPRAIASLDARDLAEIDRDFARVADPIFEASVRDAYAAYSPVVRYFAEQPGFREAVGALDTFLDSALTLGETLFGTRGRR